MKKVVTFGEIMLRLKSPDHERLFQSPVLEATFGGGEANVAVSLSIFGQKSAFVTALPDHSVGNAAISELNKYGVETDNIVRNKGRLGIYFVESGACQRPSLVVYDRADSCIAKAEPASFDWKMIFSDAQWFHLTGITPAISQSAADIALDAIKEAKKLGITTSMDLNYRKKLWNYGKKAPEIMRELVKYTDVVIANEEDIQKCLGIEAKNVDVSKGKLSTDDYKELTAQVMKEFPNVKKTAVTMRESMTADKNGWSAVLASTDFFVSRRYLIEDIVDRVGGGDSFSAGLIYGLINYPDDDQKALEFAVASSCLKHTIPGDFNLTQKNEVLNLMGGDGSGRVQR